jgi:hypothetical protein
MRRPAPLLLTLVLLPLLALPLLLGAQSAAPEDTSAQNARQARAALDAMVQALGGPAWLNLRNQTREGHVAAFFQGKPSGGTTLFFEFHSWPDHDRVEFTRHRDVVQIYNGRQGWEVTYRGKKPLPQEQVDDFLRRRDHSIETAVRLWLNDPRTILIYEGQHLAARHLAEQVTLISAENEAVTILMDVQTHLPLRRTFQWRDPVYKDKNLDAEEYDDYHTVDGFPTPFTTTRLKNDEMVSQRFLDHATYNQSFDADFWNPDAAEHRIRK